MHEKKLGKIKKVSLRDFWKCEASDFTTWLAEIENLALLSDSIGIEISLINKEANVGRFNVDILAEEVNTSRKIIIENQLEKTNHDHLGKIITYASGTDAEIIIWIVKEALEEHRQAVDWLNEHTDENINFFLLLMELWQINDSPPAPKLQIISKPNDWAKAVKKSTMNTQLSDTKRTQFDFWNKFKEYAEKNNTKLRLKKAQPQHWYDISYGSSDSYISLTINTQKNELGCEIYIPDSKDNYKKLYEQKNIIEKELSLKLDWQELPIKKASRIKIVKPANFNKIEEWKTDFEWLKNSAEEFQRVFKKY